MEPANGDLVKGSAGCVELPSVVPAPAKHAGISENCASVLVTKAKNSVTKLERSGGGIDVWMRAPTLQLSIGTEAAGIVGAGHDLGKLSGWWRRSTSNVAAPANDRLVLFEATGMREASRNRGKRPGLTCRGDRRS